MAQFSFIDLFAGIGGFRLALESLGWRCLDFSEFDNVYVSKLLSLMASYNVLERLAKGIYYKPIVTDYGMSWACQRKCP